MSEESIIQAHLSFQQLSLTNDSMKNPRKGITAHTPPPFSLSLSFIAELSILHSVYEYENVNVWEMEKRCLGVGITQIPHAVMIQES